MRAGFGCVTLEGEPRRAFEIAVHERRDTPFGNELLDDDIELHAIRKRRRHDPVQHGALFECFAFNGELAQPAPPRREAVDPDHRRPELGYRYGKGERAVILDNVQGVGHAVTIRTRR